MTKIWIVFCLIASLARAATNDEIQTPPRNPYLLSDVELTKMKEEIRLQCRLPKKEERLYPWYYHYELGLALQHKNDWQRALDSFISALDRKDQPQKGSRIYGMWFLDYYPYYNIGLAHYHMRNWKCAAESFRLSQSLEDISSNKKKFQNLLEFQTEVENHLKTVMEN
jgi:hypothetical protein